MRYQITLDLEIEDTHALNHYVSTVVAPKCGLQSADVFGLPEPDLLGWIYDTGALAPGIRVLDCKITHERKAADETVPFNSNLEVVPGLIPW
jgi:hypothetical protein